MYLDELYAFPLPPTHKNVYVFLSASVPTIAHHCKLLVCLLPGGGGGRRAVHCFLYCIVGIGPIIAGNANNPLLYTPVPTSLSIFSYFPLSESPILGILLMNGYAIRYLQELLRNILCSWSVALEM